MISGRRKRRKQKAVGEGEQLAAANPPFHSETGDNGGRRSICFYLSFFILFFPHCAAGRCFTFSFACSLSPLPSHLFCHLPGQQFLLFMSQTGSRDRETEGEGFFSLSLIFSPLLSILPALSPLLSLCSPRSHPPTLLPPSPPLHSSHRPHVTLASFTLTPPPF